MNERAPLRLPCILLALCAFAAEAAAQTAPTSSANLPAIPAQTAPVPTAVPVRHLAPDAAVREAFANNPSFKTNDLELARARQQVLAEEGRYPYVFQADAGHTRSTSPRLSAGDRVS